MEISTSSASGTRIAIAAPVGVPSAPQQSHEMSVSDAANISSISAVVASSNPGVVVAGVDEVDGAWLVDGTVDGTEGALVPMAVAE